MLHKLLSSLSRGNGFESIDAFKRSTADLRNRRMMFGTFPRVITFIWWQHAWQVNSKAK